MGEDSPITVDQLVTTARKVVLSAMENKTEEIKLTTDVQVAIEVLKIYKKTDKSLGQTLEQLEKDLG